MLRLNLVWHHGRFCVHQIFGFHSVLELTPSVLLLRPYISRISPGAPLRPIGTNFVKFRLNTREFKSREVAQAPIYVIVHSLLGLSFCTQPFPTPSGWLCRCVLTLVMALWRCINFVLLLLFLILGRYDPEGVEKLR